MQSSKRAFSQRILACLQREEVYFLSEWPRGNELDGNQHIRQKDREDLPCGAVPDPNDDLQRLFQKHDSQEKLSSSASSTRSRSSVVKELWAKKGMTFLGTGPICPLPTPDEEDYQINLALRESQRTTRIVFKVISYLLLTDRFYLRLLGCESSLPRPKWYRYQL